MLCEERLQHRCGYVRNLTVTHCICDNIHNRVLPDCGRICWSMITYVHACSSVPGKSNLQDEIRLSKISQAPPKILARLVHGNDLFPCTQISCKIKQELSKSKLNVSNIFVTKELSVVCTSNDTA